MFPTQRTDTPAGWEHRDCQPLRSGPRVSWKSLRIKEITQRGESVLPWRQADYSLSPLRVYLLHQALRTGLPSLLAVSCCDAAGAVVPAFWQEVFAERYGRGWHACQGHRQQSRDSGPQPGLTLTFYVTLCSFLNPFKPQFTHQ